MKWQIGEVMVTKIVELEVTGGSRFILPQAMREAILPIGWLRPDFADELGRLKMSIHALVVETPSRRIIVDTCLGNDKENRRIPNWNKLQTTFLADLAAAGYARETIDTVICTHLHVDHVGWNTMLVDDRWVPTFPNARYLMGRVEFEHWTTPTLPFPARGEGKGGGEDMAAVLADSVIPVWNAGLADLVETDYRICDEVSLVPIGPYSRPRQCQDRLGWKRGADHRRFHALSLPDRPAGMVLDRGYRSGGGAADARAHVDPPRRYPDPGHRHAFRRTHGRPCHARR